MIFFIPQAVLVSDHVKNLLRLCIKHHSKIGLVGNSFKLVPEYYYTAKLTRPFLPLIGLCSNLILH